MSEFKRAGPATFKELAVGERFRFGPMEGYPTSMRVCTKIAETAFTMKGAEGSGFPGSVLPEDPVVRLPEESLWNGRSGSEE